MTIAIDGPAGTGKSTVAARVSKELGFTYLNSGSFYRALTKALIDEGFDLVKLDAVKESAGLDATDEKAIINTCAKQKLDYNNGCLYLNGENVESVLHEDKVSRYVAQVSAIVEVRNLVNCRMRQIVKKLDIVCEGRDMTTVVFPEAECKFYLDATIEEQAKRRFNQGVSKMTMEEIMESIKARDAIDKGKKVGALKVAEDAKYIDTTHLTIDEVVSIITSTVRKRLSCKAC